ncbi:MAG: VWA domain-containing protein [Planctomycetota bacterium]|nr:MAG: VWA domain-containing protein [Planctomycetota bacterium]REJ94349.1 MAG: VWA domain-containing protein [Planctomycetota bacterium]REK27295.1 MAG: VWA domain-containing protein [Planctomycetota bacterium]REK36684.1 MAG: VWA domain-containing protein [Planctomycetota bacterium]
MKLRLFAILGILAGLCQSAAFAQGVLIVTDADRIIPLPRPTPQPPEASYCIKEIGVNANITSQVARVQVSQSFVNTGSSQLEVQFVFPLPYDGAIDQLTLMVDGKEYPAELMPADKARGIYEAIVRKNRDPALLEWVGTGMFQTSVFPVPPGAERKVTLNYTQLLRQSQRLTDFLFPLSTAKYTSKPIERLSFRVAIESAAPMKSIYSPTHAVNVERPDDRHAVVTYEATQQIPGSDFRLFYDIAEGPVGASVVSFRPTTEDDGYFLLLASPQIKAEAEDRTAKNVVFVLDRSGSMEGKKIEQAREALIFVLNNLREGDRFNIVAYDSSVESFRPELQPWNEETRAAAVGFVNGIYAGGGTNIDQALGTALPQFKDAEGPGYMLFLTDGLPTVGETNEAKIVAASKQANPGKVRMINFGVGFDVNSRLLDRLAREHFGQSEYVRPDENLEVHVSRLYKKISAPAMTDVTVAFDFDLPRNAEDGPVVHRIYPKQTPDLFEGEQLVLVGRYRASGNAKVTISGTLNGQPHSFDFPAQFTPHSPETTHGFVEKLWAMRRIGEIIDELDLSGQNEELVKELVALSTRHGILTPYTSFLADDTARPLAAGERFDRANESLSNLSAAEGRRGFSQREFKNRLQQSEQAAGDAFFTSPAAPAGVGGRAIARDFETDEAIDSGGIKAIGNQSLYRRGVLWVTPETEQIDLEKDQALITVIERFTPEYFELVAANTAEENRLLSSQQESEELLVNLRGQVYHIK